MVNYNINHETQLGSIHLSDDVFKDIAKLAMSKIPGVYPGKKEADSVACKTLDNDIKLTLYIKLGQGKDVTGTCTKLQRKVHEDIVDMTGIDCKVINLDIVGFISE